MNIKVYYVSRRPELYDFVTIRPNIVNDYEFLTQHGITCEVVPKREGELASLVTSDELLRNRERMEGCILLVEQGVANALHPKLKIVALTCVFELGSGPIASPQNVIARDVVRSIRLFRSIKNAIQSDLRVWRLPVQNFESQLYHGFVGRMTRGLDVNQAGEALNVIQADLQGMRRTIMRPRSRSNNPQKYCVDDRNKFFDLGHEVHAQIDTRMPHTPLCVALNSFRFGIKISEEHHYNVSLGEGDRTWVMGAFSDCHGGQRIVREGEGKTHLNMFSNDFF
ncbi:hypothetical protein [Pseudomonas qingdaonensis]|uniref:hypothetical protein n=1 Tax=Pseudomonas qingdaonensis TaxID=2056231 RepID=UPI0028AD9F53|nr:hypothetical protein [Pseudomonas qingdaonensis]